MLISFLVNSMSNGRNEVRSGRSDHEVLIRNGKKINFPPDEKFLTKARGRPSRSLNSTLIESSTSLSIPNFRNEVR